MDLSSKKVAIIVHNYFEQAEFTKPLKALKDAAAEVHVISASGEPKLQAMEGDVDKAQEFQADMLFADADLTDYDAVVLPGGTVNADNLRTNDAVLASVKDFADSGKPLAVICHAPWVLVSNGVAKGKQLTSFPSLQDDIRNAGGDWIDQEVVIDGNLITSRSPDDLPAFCSALLNKLQPINTGDTDATR